jgi:hypothetical protein
LTVITSKEYLQELEAFEKHKETTFIKRTKPADGSLLMLKHLNKGLCFTD